MVSYRDHALAHEILARFGSENPDRPFTGIRRDYDFLIFGSAIGASIGLIVVVVAQQLQMLMFATGMALLGAMFGHLLDRIRGNSGPGGRFRITMYEWLLGVAVLALLLSMRQLMNALS